MAATLVITGATGFIGRALLAAAQKNGLSVVGLTRSPVALQEGKGALRTLAHPSHLGAALGDLGPLRIIHAAAPGTRLEDRSSEALTEGCVSYTLGLVEACARINVERFVNVSSWSAYADPPPETPVLSETSPLNRSNIYGAAKASAELMGSALAARHGTEFRTARLFNVYGPGEAEARLLPHVVSHLKRHATVALTPGLQERDFVFIDDAVEALLCMAYADHVPDHAYNIATGTPVSVRSMVERMCEILGAPADLLKFGAIPARPDEPPRVVGDPSRARSVLGWRARTGIDAGLRLFLSRYDSEGAP